jgi:hypothetical protein
LLDRRSGELGRLTRTSTTAASGPFSGGTSTALLPSCRARRAMGSTGQHGRILGEGGRDGNAVFRAKGCKRANLEVLRIAFSAIRD